jgi:hypothetical protein
MSFFITDLSFQSEQANEKIFGDQGKFHRAYICYNLTEPNEAVYRVMRLWAEGTTPIPKPSQIEVIETAKHCERVEHNLEKETTKYRGFPDKCISSNTPSSEIAKVQKQEAVLTKNINRLNKTINDLQTNEALIPILQTSISVLDNEVTVLTKTLNEMLAPFKC